MQFEEEVESVDGQLGEAHLSIVPIESLNVMRATLTKNGLHCLFIIYCCLFIYLLGAFLNIESDEQRNNFVSNATSELKHLTNLSSFDFDKTLNHDMYV
jgi:hypothetical protein